MIFTPTSLEGAYIIDIKRIEDDRGFFTRAWCNSEFGTHGLNADIAQINIGFNLKKGTLRGMHYQVEPHVEVKVVRCTQGAVYDVMIDLRPDSLTYKRWFGAMLSAENYRMLYVPERFAHGYLTLTENAEIYYLASIPFAPEYAKGIRYNDPVFGISWPGAITTISEKDASWPDFIP